MDILKAELIERGRHLGFPVIGITDVRPFDLWCQAVEVRKAKDSEVEGIVSRLTPSPKDLMPDAKAIVVAVHPYLPYPEKFPEGVARYSAHYVEYPRGRKAVEELAGVITQRGYKVMVEPPLPAKAAAYRAGVGTFGKNGLIYVGEYGSWVTLHLILTDAPLPCDSQPQALSLCGKCERCIHACPTYAIADDGAVLPGRCLRAYMLTSEFVPVGIREKLGTRLLGCDVCQMVCPRNSNVTRQARFPKGDHLRPFDVYALIEALVENDRKAIEAVASLIGRNYARPQRLLSSAIIAAGNFGQQKFIPLLIRTLKHPHPPIRAYSAWALGKIGGRESMNALADALEDETDKRVVQEIKRAQQIAGLSECRSDA
ncbi:epoxyqueuosine reductase [Caldicoprobacter guelmensis]|uniref:epoxyqueuosine reductase n=1 Tax=Caldicoprobacter guelmensis TaxID=1170224 RepID=UPI001FAFC5C5|nr:4Fe-4S double cluster binding domain-containing protein [Caldicoprobacter guelmensis]